MIIKRKTKNSKVRLVFLLLLVLSGLAYSETVQKIDRLIATKLNTNTITNVAGTGSPSFPNGLPSLSVNTLTDVAGTGSPNFPNGLPSLSVSSINVDTIKNKAGTDQPVGGVPAGAIMAFAMSSCPSGWLEANGTLRSKTTYSTLCTNLGILWGAGDASNCATPNFSSSNRYLRAAGGSMTVGTLQAQTTAPNGLGGTAAGQTLSTTNQSLDSGAAAALGTTNVSLTDMTMDASGGHTHGMRLASGAPLSAGSIGYIIQYGGGTDYGTGSSGHWHGFSGKTNIDHSHGVSGTTNIGHTHSPSTLTITSAATETRPVTAAVLYCIKY